MIEAIKEIYKVADLRQELKAMARNFRLDKIHLVKVSYIEGIKCRIDDFCELLKENAPDLRIEFIENFNNASYAANSNHILAADILDEHVVVVMDKYLSRCQHFSVEDSSGSWRLISSACGYLTLKDLKNNKLIHSTIDPMEEGYLQAQMIFRPWVQEYVFLGCGLGYLPYQVYKLSDCAAKITIFETNKVIAELAKDVGVLEYIAEDKISIKIVEDYLECLKYIDETEAYLHIFAPTYKNEVNKDEISIIDSLVMNQITELTFEPMLSINCYYNHSHINNLFTDIDWIGNRKIFNVVAAGPSLDDSIEYISKVDRNKQVIICVGRAFNKLLQCGIKPDFTVYLDPQNIVEKQIEGIENEDVPAIIANVASWTVAHKYKGPKYLLMKYGVSTEFSKLAIEKEQPFINMGSTVTQTAVYLSIYWGAEEIHLIGVDLAYPGGQEHTKGTFEYKKDGFEESEVLIEDVNGRMIGTNPAFKDYIRDMEECIANNENVIFYNHSKIGAKIIGAVKYEDN
ncbi:MAG: motility associated factor glycosyltransferase family protein [Pseudobutyrivibrio sp.]|nr:motility associated factor glycosyltransferase family protein [Pseudobutyrivibrio sp.]